MGSSDDDRLPHSLEAERAVLGACLIHQEHVSTVAAILGEGDWYRDAHRLIWRAVLRVSEVGRPVDLLTIRQDLQDAGVLDTVGGPAYVSSLTDGVPRSTNVMDYARIVARAGALRQIQVAIGRGAAADDVCALADRLAAVAAAGPVARFIKASEVEPQHVEWLWRKRLAPGEITALSGLPGAGKSLMAVDVAAHVTMGYPLPDDPNTDREPDDVAWIGHASEDNPARTIVPRFEAAGGNSERFYVLDTVADVTLAAACAAAAEVNPALVVVDSWAAWGADAATDSGTEAADRYRAFERLRAQGAAVLVITHDRKEGADDDSVRAVSGSVQTTAKPRTVLHVKGGELRALKGNIAGRADTLVFAVEGVSVNLRGQTFTDVPRLVWESVPIPAGRSPGPEGDGDTSGLTVDDVVEFVSAQHEPATENAIRRGLKMDSRRKRQTVNRLLSLAVDRGLLVKCSTVVRGREYEGFKVSEQNGRLRPAPAVPAVQVERPAPQYVQRCRPPLVPADDDPVPVAVPAARSRANGDPVNAVLMRPVGCAVCAAETRAVDGFCSDCRAARDLPTDPDQARARLAKLSRCFYCGEPLAPDADCCACGEDGFDDRTCRARIRLWMVANNIREFEPGDAYPPALRIENTAYRLEAS